MQLYTICGIVFLILVISIVLMALALKSNAKKISSLEKENKQLQYNVEYIYRYSETIATIKREMGDINEEIKQAETTDEIIDILNRVISSNNDKLSNS